MILDSYIRYFIITGLIIIPTCLLAQITSPCDTFPVPPKNKYDLFYLQRQPNANTIVVELNVKNGKVDDENPVHAYWIRFTEKGQRAGLNYIQRTFAYGIDSKKIKEGIYELNFVSYKKLKIRLERDSENTWRVFYKLVNGNFITLKRIYLHINGGSFWSPNVEYVEIKGNNTLTNKEVRERIKLK
jgi:hypothetical protein